MTFYCNIAVLGCGGSGKSSVVNALCGNLVAQVAKGDGASPTTLGIDAFELLQLEEDGSDSSSPKAATILNQVTQKNEALRRKNDDEGITNLLQDDHQHYLVSTAKKEPPITIWKHCHLTVMDSPPASNRSPHIQDCFREKWGSLDAIVVVLDATTPVDDNKEQMELLKFVQQSRDTLGKIPCFILWNKINTSNNGDQQEEQEKLQRAYQLVETVFGVESREKALTDLLNQQTQSDTDNNQQKQPMTIDESTAYPVVVPTCARTAMLLRTTVSEMTKEEFTKTVALESFEEIGKQECRGGGEEWDTFSLEQKYNKMYSLLNNNISSDSQDNNNSESDSVRQRLWRASGFDKLFAAMDKCIGSHVQPGMAATALEHMMNSDVNDPSHVLRHLDVFTEMHAAMGQSTKRLRELCFQGYPTMAKAATETFQKDYKEGLKALVNVAYRLQALLRLSTNEGHEEHTAKVGKAFMQLLLGFFATIHHHANEWDFKRWFSLNENFRRTNGWYTLSPVDWQNLLGSVLLLRYEPVFAGYFGPEILALDAHKSRLERYLSWCSKGGGEGCTFGEHKSIQDVCKVELAGTLGGRPKPLDPSAYRRFVKLEVPRDFATCPNHFGHLIYLFCRSIDNNVAIASAGPLPSFWTSAAETQQVDTADEATPSDPKTKAHVSLPAVESSFATNNNRADDPKEHQEKHLAVVLSTVGSSATTSEANSSQPPTKKRRVSHPQPAAAPSSPPPVKKTRSSGRRQRRTPQRLQ